MKVIVHENRDKWPNFTPVEHLFRGFNRANLLLVLSVFTIMLQLFTNNLFQVYFFSNMST